LYAFDDFTEAAKKAIKIAGQSPEGHAFGTDLWQEAQLGDKDMNARSLVLLQSVHC